jgi:hypothetical protein
MRGPIFSNPGQSFSNKIKIFQQYKFVLAFENNNITDYVTEKMINVLQAGSVPVYMGAPNVHPDWTPGENSILRTDDFESPKHLAEFLQRMCENEEEYSQFFEWKKKGLSSQFKKKLSECIFYGAECRLCEYLLEQRKKLQPQELEVVNSRRTTAHVYQILSFHGKDEYILIPHHPLLSFGNEFTLGMWIRPWELSGSQPLLEKGMLRLELFQSEKRSSRVSYAKLCVNEECYRSNHPLHSETWYRIFVTYKNTEESAFVRFVINGI